MHLKCFWSDRKIFGAKFRMFSAKFPVRARECTEKCLRSAQNEILTQKCCRYISKRVSNFAFEMFLVGRKKFWRQISDIFGEISDIFGFFRRIFSICLAMCPTPRRTFASVSTFFLGAVAQKLRSGDLAPRWASVPRCSGAWGAFAKVVGRRTAHAVRRRSWHACMV